LIEIDEDDLLDSSSSYIYEIIESTSQPKSNEPASKLVNPIKNTDVLVKGMKDLQKKQNSFKSLLSDEELQDLYEYSDDEEEEAIYPFEQSPTSSRDEEEPRQKSQRHSVQYTQLVEKSDAATASLNPLEKLLKTTAKLQKERVER